MNEYLKNFVMKEIRVSIEQVFTLWYRFKEPAHSESQLYIRS